VISDPRFLAAGLAQVVERFEPDLGGGLGTALISWHEGFSPIVKVALTSLATLAPRLKSVLLS
jgi:hypothetical protein